MFKTYSEATNKFNEDTKGWFGDILTWLATILAVIVYSFFLICGFFGITLRYIFNMIYVFYVEVFGAKETKESKKKTE